MFHTNNPALLIIDCQLAIDSFDNSIRCNPTAESEISKLLDIWRQQQMPVLHIRHSSKSSNSPYHASKPSFAFKPEVFPKDNETIITKSENCAFVGTNLKSYLDSQEIKELVVCGVLTHHSVDATVRYACALGYNAYIPENCTASFSITTKSGCVISSDLVQDIFLTNLDGEYCQVVDRVAM
ncbi:MAG: isochorismatase family protein [Gammaproteobacteria bacterium]|jgi:nicotinamidase-related amidase|nr:isochorismatase family protein [Gammaproteobacteria bacterium]